MFFYPQLQTGAVAQFPLAKSIRLRTAMNESIDARQIKLFDSGSTLAQWELQYQGLSDAERTALESLFRNVEGRLQTFTFLDPTTNLLLWSEELAKNEWIKDPLLQIGEGGSAPSGPAKVTRLTNAAQVSQGLFQPLQAPGWFTYCFSLYVRSAGVATVKLSLLNENGSTSNFHTASENWGHISCSGAIEGDASTIECRLELAPGSSLDVYGLQLEPQRNPSSYTRSTDRGGIYMAARFDHDRLDLTSQGPNDHSVTVRIISSLEL